MTEFQSCLPPWLTSKARTHSLLSIPPMMYRTLPTRAGPLKPMPSPLAFHSSFGPSLGHSFSRPVSRQMPSRLGPRQAGQSSARRPRANMTTVNAESRIDNRRQRSIIVASPTEKNMWGRSGPPVRCPGRIIAGIVAHWGRHGNNRGQARPLHNSPPLWWEHPKLVSSSGWPLLRARPFGYDRQSVVHDMFCATTM